MFDHSHHSTSILAAPVPMIPLSTPSVASPSRSRSSALESDLNHRLHIRLHRRRPPATNHRSIVSSKTASRCQSSRSSSTRHTSSKFPLTPYGVPAKTSRYWRRCAQRSGDRGYKIGNLHVVDESNSRVLGVGNWRREAPFAWSGTLGGAVVMHKLFDNGEGRITILAVKAPCGPPSCKLVS